MSTTVTTTQIGTSRRKVIREVDPEIAQLVREATGKATHHCRSDRYADSGGHEVLNGQTRHLYEVTHRGLARVRLPVRVRHKTDRGVPRDVGRDRGETQREPQLVLQSFEGVEKQDRHRRESKHAAGVDAPALLDGRIDADDPIDHALRARVLGP
jgi:hypothetical protein